MQGKYPLDYTFTEPLRQKYQISELEHRGIQIDTGAPVTGAVAVGDAVAASFGDGTVRFFWPDRDPTVAHAHHGVVLCLTSDNDYVLTGGDDGRFVRISLDGNIEELANFDTKWVDCVAANLGLYACSSLQKVLVWSVGQTQPTELEHSGTVGGLAFDSKGERLAVTHYGGATVWQENKRRWKRSRFVWKGSHGATTFSPDGKYLVTAMQENALHGWRIRDKANLSMAGYPAKIKSFAWVGETPYLVTSGASEAICWPFDGKDGPMNRSPVCVANGGEQIASCVQAMPSEQAVFTGFKDGTVLLAELDEKKKAIVCREATGVAVTAIAVTDSRSHLLIGDAKGGILWTPFQA
mgnify:CR=1 FL=1